MSLSVESSTSALGALYWRAEILQALYWMRGEGLAEHVDVARLAAFLAVDSAVLERHMLELTSDGFLLLEDGMYALTSLGVSEGGRSFQDEFGDLTRPAHYECGPGCWCQDPDHIGEACPSHPEPAPEPETPPTDE